MAMRHVPLAALVLVSLSGCDGAPREVPAVRDAEEATRLARPDVLRMAYDPTTRTLSLYELPDNARWMLATPGNRSGERVNLSHAFRIEVDPDAVAVYYTSASGQASPKVTLREIVAVPITHNP